MIGQFFGDGGLSDGDVCFIKIPPGMPIAVIGGALGICASLALIYRFLIRGKVPGAPLRNGKLRDLLVAVYHFRAF